MRLHPKHMKGPLAIEKYIAQSGLDRKLYELIKMRASQINGCHFCINMHSRDALKAGNSAGGFFYWMLGEKPIFTPKRKEQCLALTEEMTLIANHHVSDEVYNHVAHS